MKTAFPEGARAAYCWQALIATVVFGAVRWTITNIEPEQSEKVESARAT